MDVKRAVHATIRAHAKKRKPKRRYAEGGVTADDMIAQARDLLQKQPREPAPDTDRGPWGGIGAAMPESYGANSPILDPLAKAVAGVATLPKRLVDQAHHDQATGEYHPGPYLEAAMLPMGTGAITGVPMRAGETALGAGPIRAYHGSPHDFDRFDMSKVGSGEGHQSYGHGLYFAENPEVARVYRDALEHDRPDPRSPDSLVRSVLDLADGDPIRAAQIIEERRESMRGLDPRFRAPGSEDRFQTVLDALKSDRPILRGGKFYKVNINADPSHLLDLDKQLTEQSPSVKKALTDLKVPLEDSADRPAFQGSGRDLYWYLNPKQKRASAELNEAGVPGLKYLDSGSRRPEVPEHLASQSLELRRRMDQIEAIPEAGRSKELYAEHQANVDQLAAVEKAITEHREAHATRNLVMFNDKLVDILKKYGIAGAAAPAAAEEIMNHGKNEMASGGRIGYADGGAPDDAAVPTFDPNKFAEIKAAAPPPAFDPAKFAAVKQAAVLPDVAKEGGKGLVRGAEGFLGDMGEAVMGPFGPSHHAANLLADLGLRDRPAPEPTYGQQLAHATGVEATPQTTPGKFAGTIGDMLGNPSTYFGQGGWLAKLLMGTAAGAGSEAAGEATEGTPWEGPARVGGALLVGPAAARMVKPQVAAPQQALLDQGVRLTPGQLAGGQFKSAEDKLTSMPILGDLINSARGRSVEGFNRSVANKALEPIGESLGKKTAAGHDAVAEVGDKLGNAYDNLVPQLQLRPDQQWFKDLRDIYERNAQIMPEAETKQFQKIIDQEFGRPAPLDGEKVKRIEQKLTGLAGKYGSSSDAGHQLLGEALGEVKSAIRSNLQRANPAHADELAQINAGWAMYARMRTAAANRSTSGGLFTPGDLLAAIKRGDKTVGKGGFAKGNALMQDYAEAGQSVLPNKVPDSGTAGRAFMNGLLGGGAWWLSPKVAAGVGAATLPYTRPAVWAINKYVAPTTGVRAGYANAGRGVGTLRPLLNTSPYGNPPGAPYQQQ